MKKVLALLVGLLLLPAVLAGCKLGKAEDASAASPEPNPTVTVIQAVPGNTDDIAIDIVAGQGFKKEGIQLVSTPAQQARAEQIPAGQGAFADMHLTTPEKAASFISSGTPKANVVLQSAIKETGATRDQLANSANWKAIITDEKVVWKGNTYHLNGKILRAGARVDSNGSVIMLFLPPDQVAAKHITSVFWLRGSCGNPQIKPPTPGPGPGPGPGPNGKEPTSWVCSQNWTPGCPPIKNTRQPPQDNSTSGVNTGGTPGAPAKPHRPPRGPDPQPGKQPPPNNGGGYNSGGGTGSAPGGSTTDNGGTSGGGAVTPPNPPADSGQGGNNNSDPGGF